jgi:hypothetical protein
MEEDMKDNDQINYQTLDHDGDDFIQKVTDTVIDNIKRYPKLKVIVVPKTFTIPCLNPKLRLDFVAPIGNPIRLGKNIPKHFLKSEFRLQPRQANLSKLPLRSLVRANVGFNNHT